MPGPGCARSVYFCIMGSMSDRMQRVGEFLEFFASDPGFLESDTELDFSHYRYEYPERDGDIHGKIELLKQINARLAERLPPAAQFSENLEINYAQALNARQQAAVACREGPLLVLAGAGSGKTRTLVYRLSYLLEQGVTANRILLLTFTRRAAQQMLERAQLLRAKSGAHQVMGGTFHSFCAYLLRRLSPLTELTPHFSIIDTVDACDIIDLIVQELQLRGKDRAFPRKRRIQEIISKARNAQVELPVILEREYPDLLERYSDDLELIASTFARYKQGNQLLDYDDLIICTRDYLLHNAAFARKARQLFDYIMVDEYQDTNLIQKELADALASEHRNLMVVGDDAQSIYGFRGANYENILRFPQSWPDCHVVKLEQNYRSTQSILDFTNQILNRNQLVFPKHLFSERPGGPLPQIRREYKAEDEAAMIADKILALRHGLEGQSLEFSEMAVLFRSGYHSNYLQAELLKRRIPFVVYGGIRFIERRHIKDMVAHLRILMNPLDALAWHRILQLLPGVGKVTARKIMEHVRARHGQIEPAALGKKKFARALENLQNTFTAARQASSPAAQLELLRGYYLPLLKSVESDYLQRLPDLDVLADLAAKYEKLERFLTDFALDPPNQQFQDQSAPGLNAAEAFDEAPVVLSTVHSAKGLEWKAVFVLHLLDGLFPSRRALENYEELEEERRLFYVACSRAEDQLYLSLPSHYASYSDFFNLPSRFVGEVKNKYYDNQCELEL